jgi:hypothetical protein
MPILWENNKGDEMTDNETAVKMLLQLEAEGWDNTVRHDGDLRNGDTWHIVTLSKGGSRVSAAGSDFLEVVQRAEGMTK